MKQVIFVATLALVGILGCGKQPTKEATSEQDTIPPMSLALAGASSSSSAVVYRPPGISLVVFGEDGSTPALARATVAATSSTNCSAVQSLRQCGSSSSKGGSLPSPRVIYLGDTWNSTLNLFAIQNTGTVPLLGLKMRHSNPNFMSQPDSIPILGVPGDIYSDMVSILKVWVGHGTYGARNTRDPLLWNGDTGDEVVKDTLWFTWDTDTVGVKFILETRARVAAISTDGVLLGNCQVGGLLPGDTIPPDKWVDGILMEAFLLTADESCLAGAGLWETNKSDIQSYNRCTPWEMCNVLGY